VQEVESIRAKGDLIGWIDNHANALYLDEVAALKVAQSMTGEGDRLPLNIDTLRRRLHDDRCLITTGLEKRQTYTVRKTAAGVRREVLHVSPERVFPAED
jgi:hypothetical protein